MNPDNINLYQSVTVLSTAGTEAIVDGDVTDVGFDVMELALDSWSNLRGFITTDSESPIWGTDTILETKQYDLHLFYSPAETDLLFESTSNTGQMKELREVVVEDSEELRRVDGGQLSRVLQSLENPKYRVTGMTNTSIASGSQPGYKAYYGDDVQGAVHHSDARNYAHGHTLATFESDEETVTRGVSSGKAKVWSNSKASIEELKQWCDSLVERLTADTESGIQNLESLDPGDPVDCFAASPFAVTLHPKLAGTPIEIAGDNIADDTTVKPDLTIETDVAASSDSLTAVMRFEEIDLEVSCSYDLAADSWGGEISDFEVATGGPRRRSGWMDGDEFLEEHPPVFFLENGEIIIGGKQHSSETDLSRFDPATFTATSSPDWGEYIQEGADEKPDWYNSDNEGTLANRWENNDPSTVFEALVRWLMERRDLDEYVLFCDDEGGEAADFIEFCVDERDINLYHCKGGYSAGVSLGRFKDIYQQTVRSLRYVDKMKLVDHVDKRRTPGTLQHFICGEKQYDELKAEFNPATWDYTIYGVNPGFRTDFDPESGTQSHRNVGRLLSECVEQVDQCNAEFKLLDWNDSW
ncbi:hypothetical protein [Halorubellus salinus]|uniref:hypothetical protein n=1 Tax=Halorubellus salinus TaxID=755309 RepID=UPI001D078781|nr:hypothetical protein [Halorubellus salinus]